MGISAAPYPLSPRARPIYPCKWYIMSCQQKNCAVRRPPMRAWFKLGRMRVTRRDWRARGVSPLFSLPYLRLCQQGAYAPRSPSVIRV
jgi:hypothetical protein